ncbi:MAG: transcription-repair coupling factor [Gammaproteobacteria bacterium]
MTEQELLTPFRPTLPEKKGDRLRWTRLYGSSKALAIANALDQHDGPLLVITADNLIAERLASEIEFYVAGKSLPIKVFPSWETLPYDQFSPYHDIISDRLATLAQLPSFNSGVLITSVSSLMHRLPPEEYVNANSFSLATGDNFDLDAFRKKLELSGYRYVSQVLEHGDFAIRGSLLDVFPMGSNAPVRIDLFDDEVDSLRYFDPETQRSTETLEQLEILPGHEFPLTEEGITHFRHAWRDQFEGVAGECPVYRDVSDGLAAPGIEYYLPLFFDQTSTLFNFIPTETMILFDDRVEEAAEHFWEEVSDRYEQFRHDALRPILPPEMIALRVNEMFESIKQQPSVLIAGLDTDQDQASKGSRISYSTSMPMKIPVDPRAEEPLGLLKRYLDNFDGRVLIAADSTGRRETLLDTFRRHDLRPEVFEDWHDFLQGDATLGITAASLEQGLQIDSSGIAVISEPQMFGERVSQKRRRRRSGRGDPEAIVKNLTELTIGAPVIHEDHGVGRYRGLITLTTGEITEEYLELEYADGDKLFVPVASLHLISRFSGVDPDHAPLHKLGSGQWQKAKSKAAQRVHDVAAELLEIYARREARKGHAFNIDEDAYRTFSQAFPFEETPDQQTAIEAVLEDMRKERPMDRLVCGDVGFGKTEVAMRAAFVAISSGKQVAILVPTTLLSQQHFENFKDRFADWPIRVEQLSRFSGSKLTKETIAGLASGNVDIVIGTHKLIQNDIKFKQLGLLIIDEEHRFGVRQKERMKSMRSEVDILTLTATPIPRSLNLALTGTRELSIIATPPARRLAIKTFVREWKDDVIKEAIMREISRGGQVYLLHNKVETIEKMAAEVAALVPEARVHFAHGQMRERELETVMKDFYHRRFNVLVCSTIIETGIDIPSANTIIINRADKFGLAQLYQLRGRVGRSHHRAYAYLVVPDVKRMTDVARKRLEAIESLEDLGVGFTIATHDLEIRGAGEILGDDQSGHIQEIGFGMYTDMLERAVKALKEGRQPELDRPLDHGTEIDIHTPALIPEDYLPDVHTRLIMYKRIASAKDEQELNELREEVIDRFGLMPEQALNLFALTQLKIKATPLGIKKIDFGASGGRFIFNDQPNIDPGLIIRLIQTEPYNYKLENTKLRIIKDMPEPAKRFDEINSLLEQFIEKNAA